MRILKNKKVKNVNLKFNTYTYSDYSKFDVALKNNFDEQIKNVMKSISYDFKEIERCKNDIVITCQNDKTIVGFIHLVPSDYYNEASQNRFSIKKMYVDYIAVDPTYQGFGIATNLYKMAINDLAKNGVTKELSAVLLDEYSRRAFTKTAKMFNLKMNDETLDGSIVASFDDLQK